MMNEVLSQDLTPIQCDTPQSGGYRVIQIHPTQRCNLTCLHCYSNSAPHFRQELDINVLKSFLEQAWAEGFDTISISGGEPFMYSHLLELLSFAKNIGYYTSAVTNGMLLKSEKNQMALPLIDVLAVSIDGEPDYHNYLRNLPQAFDKTLEGIEIIKEYTDFFGFIHTVVPQTFNSLLWLGEFTATHKAKLLQLHPLENAGRASNLFAQLELNQEMLHKVFIMHHYLNTKYSDFVTLFDVLHRDILEGNPDTVFANHILTDEMRLIDVMKEIIIDENGNILPGSHGFNPTYKIGNIYENGDFSSMNSRFMKNSYPHLKNMIDSTYVDILQNEHIDMVNWSEMITHRSFTYQADGVILEEQFA